jgi:hypothetical protein
MGHWDTHSNGITHSGAAYYLTVTVVVFVSLVAMMNKTVCQYLALFTVLAPEFIGAARLAYYGL